MNVRVLLVDNHQDARAALAQRLGRHADMTLVGVAADLDEAVKLLTEARPSVVLYEIHGHAGGGVDGCRLLRQLTDAPVVIFTSYMTDDLWAAAREAGAAAYLLKQLDTEQLSRDIVRLAQEHQAGKQREQLSKEAK